MKSFSILALLTVATAVNGACNSATAITCTNTLTTGFASATTTDAVCDLFKAYAACLYDAGCQDQCNAGIADQQAAFEAAGCTVTCNDAQSTGVSVLAIAGAAFLALRN